MAKKSPRKAKKAAKSAGKRFSLKALHNSLKVTRKRLKAHATTSKQQELIDLVERLQKAGFCGQNMLIDLGV